ncbi:hypothetical protein N7536_007115 [Penicillium majusculum]|uniref:Uncharacterized protein n=1 Tax=Penicillium solitum TaxID=60172 RepID=A0A1V6RL08_9EURO|nr:uncharacterized protein PENSOL_c002G08579 [Penicillium solitum]KAJ5696703.1 hypothetical protein N7536_007115 [Penicillium majusculum]OQE02306.1 hypothetical protein PENSOL_c002G08579 [Penicillium solitum]
MDTREEKLASWAEPSNTPPQGIRVLKGSLSLNPNDSGKRTRVLEDRIQFNQIDGCLQNCRDDAIVSDNADNPSLWHFKAISLPRIRPGRLVLSISKETFQKIQDCWDLHPRTIEIWLSNNGVLTTLNHSGRSSLVMKVANSRTTGFDCVSVTCDPSRRTTFVLYHHLFDEDAVFNTLLSTPGRCIDPYFYMSALYRSHHQHIEVYRNTIDCTIQGIERQTGFGNPGRLDRGRRPSMDEYPALDDPKRTIQELGYCQTDIAIIGHVGRCCLDCGEWLVQAIDASLLDGQTSHEGGKQNSSSSSQNQDQQLSEYLKAIQRMVRQDVEYVRRRTAMLLSQVQQMSDRTQSQTSYMLSVITQSDAEYTAAIAIDGKRDSIAMRTISILGIVYLPATFVATLFSMDMFSWPGTSNKSNETASLVASPSIWIYWVVAVPLTVITILIWVVWARRENHKSRKRLMVSRTRSSESESGSSEKMV